VSAPRWKAVQFGDVPVGASIQTYPVGLMWVKIDGDHARLSGGTLETRFALHQRVLALLEDAGSGDSK
jgi:hypothetical protein